tara:strand:- start:114 stop:452 length:339 start_codon:yes stop_codon:yes gene_type:complete
MTLKYDDDGRPYEDLTDENKKLNNRIKELENSLSIALDNVDQYQRENKKLTEQVRDAEGETSIVKGIGMNSPEMRAIKKEVEDLKANLARAKEEHQYDNIVHANELRQLRKK